MKIKLLAFSFIFLFFAVNSYSDALPEAVQEKIDAFFQELQKGEIEAAYEKVVQGSLILKKPQQVQNLINQTNNGISLYGGVLSHELFSAHCVGDTLAKAIYISKNTNYPLRWFFVFYKAADEWVLITIEFDDDIEALLDHE